MCHCKRPDTDADVRAVLVIGTPDRADVDTLLALPVEVRELRAPVERGLLMRGVYGIHRKGRWEAVASCVGAPIATTVSARHRRTDDGDREHLAEARDLFLQQ
ncbi:hypothetical protein [Kineococcus auxinigenes]|uniref:hypothetical protein n=1 Tax=unclassified Kineococcus TaxID=2621656 RepID=UPI003D7E1A9D